MPSSGLITFFSIDALKILGARRLKRVLTPKMISKINVGTGIFFLVAGAIMLIGGLYAYWKAS